MNKLINKTLVYFVTYAFVLLLISAPLFYLHSEKLYKEDVDEAIYLRKDEFLTGAIKSIKQSEVSVWNRFNRDIKILPDTVNQRKNIIFQKFFYDTLSVEWEPYRVLYTNVRIEEKPYTLMIRLNLVESEDLIRTIGIWYLIIISILLLGFVIVSKIISSKLWKPFYHSLSVIEKFNLEKHNVPQFPNTSIWEFKKLNTALDVLFKQNIKTFKIQKEFTENASHELQTPLAIFQSELDMLLQNPDLTKTQAAIVEQLYKSLSRLSRVNKNLLLLAKMENHSFDEKENIDLVDIIKEVKTYFIEQAQGKNIQMDYDLTESIPVHANKGLVEIFINNLILNAIKHNIHKGHVFIQINSNQLIISNSGKSKALKSEALFKRFGGTATPTGSSGLGLAIIKKIADLNHWSISYSFSNDLHNFTVKF